LIRPSLNKSRFAANIQKGGKAGSTGSEILNTVVESYSIDLAGSHPAAQSSALFKNTTKNAILA
jgi:hypothetical protein